MKKITLSKIMFAVVFLFAIFAVFTATNQSTCLADFGGLIEVLGSGKTEVSPNIAKIYLGVSARADSIKNGQNEAINIIDCIEKSIKKIDESCELNIGYSSCHPIRESGTQSYQLNYCLTLKTHCIDCVDELIAKASECGATSYQNVCYELENFDDIYEETLLLAKNNAYSKAKAINPNISEIELFEVSVFNYSNDSKIVIEACVRIKYEVENVEAISNENIEPFNAEDEDNKTLISESTLIQEQDDLEERNLNETKTNELSSNSQSQIENPGTTPTQTEEQQNSINENQNINPNELEEKIDTPINSENETINEGNENSETNERANLNASSQESQSSNEELRTIKHINHQTTSDTQESGEVEVSPKVYS